MYDSQHRYLLLPGLARPNSSVIPKMIWIQDRKKWKKKINVWLSTSYLNRIILFFKTIINKIFIIEFKDKRFNGRKATRIHCHDLPTAISLVHRGLYHRRDIPNMPLNLSFPIYLIGSKKLSQLNKAWHIWKSLSTRGVSSVSSKTWRSWCRTANE